MSRVALPHDAKAGPTKSEVRAVTLGKLRLDRADHFAEVGSCTGAVTVEAAREAGRVTAVERVPERAETTRRNLAANDVPVVDDAATDGGVVAADPTATDPAPVEVREGAAPAALPADADALFLGGSRDYEAVLDYAVDVGVDRVVMNVSRLEVAGDAVEAFRERDLLAEVVQVQVSHGYELAGATSFDSQNPVYVVVGTGS